MMINVSIERRFIQNRKYRLDAKYIKIGHIKNAPNVIKKDTANKPYD